MEPATPQETTVTPSPGTRQNRTLQAILLFSLVILVVFILAVLTGAFGGKNTVTSAQATATASAQANLGIFSGGNGSSVLSGTITAGAPTAISLTPGTGQGTDSALSGSNGTSNGDTTGGSTGDSNANGSATGSQPGGSASGDQSGNATNGSLPGGTNSNPSGATGNSTGGTTGGSTGGSNGGVTGTGNSGLAGSLPGGTNSNPSSSGGNSASGSGNGSNSNSGSLPGGTNSNPSGVSGSATGSNSSASNLPSPHLGNYVCATGTSGNLTYQSDFTILEGLKYKHSSNPSQEFSFTYDPNSKVVTWLDGPNAGTVGTFYLPDGADTYKIVEKFPNNPQAAPISCMLAEK
ncbi:MAG: hypothetical protein J0I20_07325 [Chloroflexi bacterium]|nr:hypothetical protein [Chloroflexota bacterium]